MKQLLLVLLVFTIFSCKEYKTLCIRQPPPIDIVYDSLSGKEWQKCVIMSNIKFAINSKFYVKNKKGINDTIYNNTKPSLKMARFILETGWGKDSKWVNNNNPGGLFNGKKYLKFDSPYEGWAMMGHLQKKLGNKYAASNDEDKINLIIKLYNLKALDKLC